MILRQKIKHVSVLACKRKIDTSTEYLSSLLTSREIRYCQSKRHYAEPTAARIAAKLACYALFNIPTRQKKWMLQIEVSKKNNGQPFLKLSPDLKRKLKLKINQSLMLSLAHEREIAIAWVALTDAVPRGSVSPLTPPRRTASSVSV